MNSKPTLSDLMVPQTLRGRDVLGISQLSSEEIWQILRLALYLKNALSTKEGRAELRTILAGLTVCMVFEKPSLRTRASFDQAMHVLGGRAVDHEQQFDGKREPVRDIARCLHGYYQAIIARTFSYTAVEELAKFSKVPVINGLDDMEHPCQALADFLTVLEVFGKLEGINVAYVGDADNNVLHSLLLTAAKLGSNLSIGCPQRYQPNKDIMQLARSAAERTGSRIVVVEDPLEAVQGVQVVITDTHVSMGQEGKKDQRYADLAPYQVNAALMARADKAARFMHCLPAYRGREVTEDVIEGPQSLVFQEAENRMHAQAALLALVLQEVD